MSTVVPRERAMADTFLRGAPEPGCAGGWTADRALLIAQQLGHG